MANKISIFSIAGLNSSFNVHDAHKARVSKALAQNKNSTIVEDWTKKDDEDLKLLTVIQYDTTTTKTISNR